MPALQRGYDAVLARIVYRPRRAYAAVGAHDGDGRSWRLPLLGQSLLPDFKERDFLMHWVTEPGHRPAGGCSDLDRGQPRAPGRSPASGTSASTSGRPSLMDEVVGIDFGENWISVDPSVDYDETLARIQEVVDGYPGLYRDVQTYLKERIREVLTGSSEAIASASTERTWRSSRRRRTRSRRSSGGIPGVVENHVESLKDIPQMEVEVDLAAAQRYGLKPGDVRRAAARLVAGEEVGDIFRDGKAYDVHVWSTPETRDTYRRHREPADRHAERRVRPPGRRGRRAIEPVPNVHQSRRPVRSLDVGANIDGSRDLGSIVVAASRQQLDNYDWPAEYHAEFLGEYAERREAVEPAERSARSPRRSASSCCCRRRSGAGGSRSLSFLTLPIALVGGVLAAYLSGGVISLGSLVGFFTVLGIAARNGIMLISHFQHLERFEGVPVRSRIWSCGAPVSGSCRS